jgi:hypothetical protein
MANNTKASDNGFLLFLKTTVLPILIALLLYLFLFHALLPLYRRHRARYSQYLPLNSLQPSTLSTRARSTIFRIFFPSHWARSNPRRLSVSSTTSHPENELFTDEHGEAMVGFDLPQNRGGSRNTTTTNIGVNRANSTSPTPNTTSPHPQEDPTPQSQRRRRDDINRYATRNILAAREMNASSPTDTTATTNIFTYNDPPPERRLSRELEEVFRDDSADEDSEEEVTVGRGRISMSVDRHVTR